MSATAQRSFEQVNDSFGAVVQRHAKKTYDVFIHLPIEFPLVADGHRPVSERFRAMSDDLLLRTLERLEIPVHVVGGSIPVRLERVAELLGLPTVMPVEAAVAFALDEVSALNTADEVDRSTVSSPLVGTTSGRHR